MLDGRVRFVLGDREFELGPGEAAEFDTTLPHWIGSAANHPAELLPRTPGATTTQPQVAERNRRGMFASPPPKPGLPDKPARINHSAEARPRPRR